MKAMKIIWVLLLMICVFCFTAEVSAVDTNTIVNVSWQQAEPENVTHWTLQFGSVPGGPYDQQVFTLDITDFDVSGSYATPVTIQSTMYEIVTHYAVIVASNTKGDSVPSEEAFVEIDLTKLPTKTYNLQMNAEGTIP